VKGKSATLITWSKVYILGEAWGEALPKQLRWGGTVKKSKTPGAIPGREQRRTLNRRSLLKGAEKTQLTEGKRKETDALEEWVARTVLRGKTKRGGITVRS